MLRGILTGGLSGLVVGGVALTGLSLAVEQPAGNTPPASPQVSAPSETTPAEISSTVPATVADDSTGDAVAAAVPQVQIPDVTLTAPVADTTSAALPLAGAADALPAAPDLGDAPSIDAETVDPVLPNPQSIAPQVPVAEQDIAVSTVPADPPKPTVAANETAPDEAASVEKPEDVTIDEATTGQDPIETAPVEATDVVEPEMPVDPMAEDDVVEQPAPEVVVEDAPTAPVIVPELVSPEAPSVVSIVPDEAPSLPGGETGVAIRRPTTELADAAVVPEAEFDPDAPAIVRFAGKFENPQGKPLLSVVLIDDGSLDDAVGAVAAIGVPVTVVLDPDMPEAKEKLAAYRSAGIEVAVRAVLPTQATPSDVETAFEASFSKLQQTALLMDDGTGGLQNNRTTTEFAMEALAKEGRGFLTVSKGLNTALRLAEQNEVPAGVIYRDLDSEGQGARVIRRFLDQAAFRARQDGSVILLGRVRPDTVSALILWGTANRAGQVVFAPVSAALLAN